MTPRAPRRSARSPSPVVLSDASRLDPADQWPSEVGGFTPWIAENIGTLAAAVGIAEPMVRDTETRVGRFRADPAAEYDRGDEADPSTRVVENQLGSSDHDHLGKLISRRWVPHLRPPSPARTGVKCADRTSTLEAVALARAALETPGFRQTVAGRRPAGAPSRRSHLSARGGRVRHPRPGEGRPGPGGTAADQPRPAGPARRRL